MFRTLVLFAAALLVTTLLLGCYGSGSDDSSVDQPIYSPNGNSVVFSLASKNSCFLYRTDLTSGKTDRLTTRTKGCESDPSFSHDGKLIAYSLASETKGKSSIWIINHDGTNDHVVLPASEDNSHPIFAPGDKQLYFVRSRFFGHYSPVVQASSHDLDVFYVPLDGGKPTELTQQRFYSLQSLALSPDGKSLLLSTSRYPIGDLIEEYEITRPTSPHRVFQPHVPGEPSSGPAFGNAAYSPDGLHILFLAASNARGGNFDYNGYQMSSVTGGDIQQLTSRTGIASSIQAAPDGRSAVLTAENKIYVIDLQTRSVRLLPTPVFDK